MESGARKSGVSNTVRGTFNNLGMFILIRRVCIERKHLVVCSKHVDPTTNSQQYTSDIILTRYQDVNLNSKYALCTLLLNCRVRN